MYLLVVSMGILLNGNTKVPTLNLIWIQPMGTGLLYIWVLWKLWNWKKKLSLSPDLHFLSVIVLKTRLIFTSSRRSLHFCHFLYFSLRKQYAKIEVSFMLIDEETFQRRGFSDVIFCFIEGNPGAEAWFTRRFLGIRSQ